METCKCGSEMTFILDNHEDADYYVYWCPQCGRVYYKRTDFDGLDGEREWMEPLYLNQRLYV